MDCATAHHLFSHRRFVSMPRALKPIILLTALVAVAALVLLVPTRQYDARVSRAFSKLNVEARSGNAIPFELPGLHGETITLDQFRGKWVLVNFWATWCEPCRDEMPSMREFARHFPSNQLQLLAISIDSDPELISPFLVEQGITPEDFVIAHDPEGKVSARYGSRLIPETWIVDPDGQVVGRVQGALDWNQPDILSLFEVLLRDGWRAKRS